MRTAARVRSSVSTFFFTFLRLLLIDDLGCGDVDVRSLEDLDFGVRLERLGDFKVDLDGDLVDSSLALGLEPFLASLG